MQWHNVSGKYFIVGLLRWIFTILLHHYYVIKSLLSQLMKITESISPDKDQLDTSVMNFTRPL